VGGCGGGAAVAPPHGEYPAWDDSAWDAFAAELAAWRAEERIATLWWRDDDAGATDPALARLLALATRVAVPLGLAVVPAWLTGDAVDSIGAAPAGVAVLQHGFAHANHETRAAAGERKVRFAECGDAREAAIVLDEIGRGRARLAAAFGPRFRPVFVPPWNRIAPGVVAGLAELGHRAVSAFGPRPAASAGTVSWLNAHADPIAWREGRRFVGARATLDRLRAHLAARRAGQVDRQETTGLLTHHRDMDPAFWAFLERFLSLVRDHPGAHLPPLDDLLAPRRPAAPD
jgi:hypothetical protein